MSTYSKVDPSTLGWVKHEIDETLKQARLALEAFAENPSDNTRLRFCTTHLHQVVGTLLMVELDGAAILAKETEALAEAILNEKVESSSQALETLTRGILVLPDYLARLLVGQVDNPMRHLALINEFRATRDAEPVSELELFAPDLSVHPPRGESPKTAIIDAEYGDLAKQLRPAYQAALLDWLRDHTRKQALQNISDIFEQLQAAASPSVSEQLFWVAGGLVEALIEDGLEPLNERKKLFARLDQQIKKLIDGTEKSLLRTSSEALVRGMLLEISQATSSGPRVTELKRAFNLDLLTAGGTLPATESELFDLPTPEALRSVSEALAKEIEAAQDLLSTAFDSDHMDLASLEPLQELLHKMSGTLDMLGVPILKALVDELSEVSRAILDKRIENAEAVSMPMAQALLMVENSAHEIHKSASAWKTQIEQSIALLRSFHTEQAGAMPTMEGIEVSEAELTEGEFKQLLGVVADEVSVNLGKIEEALETFAADLTVTKHLKEIPQQLSQVQGALQILGLEAASQLAEATKQHVEDIRRGTIVANSTILDGLAVCVGTTGAYIEGLRAGRRDIDTLIEAALQEMNAAMESKGTADYAVGGRVQDPAQLIEDARANLEAWMTDRNNAEALSALQQSLEETARLAHAQGQEKVEKICTEINNLLDLVMQDPTTFSSDILDMLRQSFETLATLAKAHLAIAPAPVSQIEAEPAYEDKGDERAALADNTPAQVAPSPQTDMGEDFDEEIMQVFIEDARNVLETIKKESVVWREDTKNKHALAELRRGYHTLKGSGRMVGASDVAETAWAVENVLNKLREGKIAPFNAIFDLLQQTQDVMPELINQLEGGPAPTVDLDALRQTAHALAEPKAAAADQVGARKSEGGGEGLPKLESTLREIFTNEADGHLAILREEIAACREAGGACLVSDPLYRSTHTLGGNARSLGLRIMSEACSETEKLLHALKTKELPLSETRLALLTRFESTVSELVDLLNSDAASAGDLPKRFADLSRDAREESAHLVEPESVEETQGDKTAAPPVDFPKANSAQVSGPVETYVVKDPPARPAAQPAVDETAEEQADPELLEIFQEEAVDILNTVEAGLRQWRTNEGNTAALQDLKRALHTLKGGARMAGVMGMGNLSHNTESLLKHVDDGRVAPSAELFDLLEEAYDVLVTMLHKVQDGQAAQEADDLNTRLMAMSGVTAPASSADAAAGGELAREAEAEVERQENGQDQSLDSEGDDYVPAAAPIPAGDESAEKQPYRRESTQTVGESWADKHDRRGQIRVNTNLLNNLVNYAGEVSIARSRMEQQIFGFRDNLGELNSNITRFRDQLRELEIQSESQILYRLEQQQDDTSMGSDFDPLEFDRFSKLQHVSRSLTESLHDLTTIQMTMGNFVGEAESVLQQQARINTELQEGLMRTRMINFSTQAARLRHILRQTARELGKRAELRITGTEVEIDRNVLERMIGPFEHMIRNALDHGIETEAERKRAGKPVVGRITIDTSQEGSEIVIRFSDDGAGLDIDAIREKAIERSLTSRDANLTDEEMIQFILMSGFSTTSQVTHLSGRGVGMDVVHNEVKQLGGVMSVDTKRGVGTIFIIRLPLTLSITQAMMIYVGDQLFAIPLPSVVNIIEYPIDKLNKIAVGKNPLLNHDDQIYPYMNLGARLGLPAQARNGRKVPILLARAGTREVAIQIDGLGGTREIVIKSLGSQLSDIKGLAGATILGDGKVVLILDVAGLWYTDDTVHVERVVEKKPAEEARERPVIMVVDDSLTVRKVTGKHLQKRGMEVMVAKDGIDAVEQLRDRVPDVMLVDIEMPRMDGYELTSRIRSEAKLKHIPIIIITSRAGGKHRKRALELGADMYMSKPYQEEELFRNVDTLLVKGRSK
ncbi:MAG: hypothetical protein BMS9Abin22_175 [Gammaproteobacteria bacterium]|nr:MAG: hypothetical protein BMS9Abin22_175 [Gammaproteobacteria bacterium]